MLFDNPMSVYDVPFFGGLLAEEPLPVDGWVDLPTAPAGVLS